MTPEELAALEPYEDAIMAGETVEGVVGTNLFLIKYRHTDPEMAQKVPTPSPKSFAQTTISAPPRTQRKPQDILAREITDYQAKILHDQEALFNFAREKGIPPSIEPGLNVEAQRLADLSSQVLEAENQRKNAQAIYLSAKATRMSFSIPEVQKNERIIGLAATNLRCSKRRKPSLEVTYTKEWPEVKKIEVSISKLKTELEKAANDAVIGLQKNYEAALAHENSVRERYIEQRGTTNQQTRDQIEMTEFQQRLETNKQYLNTLLQKQRELEIASGRSWQ